MIDFFKNTLKRNRKQAIKLNLNEIINEQGGVVFGQVSESKISSQLKKKMLILKKANEGDSFIIVDNEENEIEYAAKKSGLNYELSTVYGDRRIIFNPNAIIKNDVNVTKMYNTGFKRILVIGKLGTLAYPILRWQIWNIENSKKCLWVDEHGNDDFIKGQMKNNIDFIYTDDFDFKIKQHYNAIFLNGVGIQSVIEKTNNIQVPIILRVGLDELKDYSINELEKLFELIIIAAPRKYDDEGKMQIFKLIGDCQELKNLNKLDDTIVIYENIIKHTKIIFPKEFPLNNNQL